MPRIGSQHLCRPAASGVQVPTQPRWAAAGMPRTVYGQHEKDPLDGVIFEIAGHTSSLHIRSAQSLRLCESNCHACAACMKLAKSKELKQLVAGKCYDMDLCTLAWKALNEAQDQTAAFIETIKKQEYMMLGLAGKAFDSLAKIGSPLQLASRIRERSDSTPLWRQNPSWKEYLSCHLTKAPLHFNTDPEAAAHTPH